MNDTEFDTDTKTPTWMVVTLKSGAQLRQRITEWATHKSPVTGELVKLTWTLHPDSPAKISHLDIDEVAAVCTEWTEAGRG